MVHSTVCEYFYFFFKIVYISCLCQVWFGFHPKVIWFFQCCTRMLIQLARFVDLETPLEYMRHFGPVDPPKRGRWLKNGGLDSFLLPCARISETRPKTKLPLLIHMAPRMCLCSYTACPFGYVLELLSAISCNAMIIGCRRVRIDSVSEWVHYWLVLMTFRWSESFRTISQNGSLSKDVVNRVSDFDFSSSWLRPSWNFAQVFCFVLFAHHVCGSVWSNPRKRALIADLTLAALLESMYCDEPPSRRETGNCPWFCSDSHGNALPPSVTPSPCIDESLPLITW